MKHYIPFLESFGVPQKISDAVISFRVKDHYYWALEKRGDDGCIIYCAHDKNFVYDGLDETLSEKLITTQDLLFKDKELGQTIVLQKYQSVFDQEDIVYVATSLRETRCLYVR